MSDRNMSRDTSENNGRIFLKGCIVNNSSWRGDPSKHTLSVIYNRSNYQSISESLQQLGLDRSNINFVNIAIIPNDQKPSWFNQTQLPMYICVKSGKVFSSKNLGLIIKQLKSKEYNQQINQHHDSDSDNNSEDNEEDNNDTDDEDDECNIDRKGFNDDDILPPPNLSRLAKKKSSNQRKINNKKLDNRDGKNNEFNSSTRYDQKISTEDIKLLLNRLSVIETEMHQIKMNLIKLVEKKLI